MAGLGLGGSSDASSSGKRMRRTGFTLVSPQGPVTPGLQIPGTTDKYPALIGNIPDTRGNGGTHVGVPFGSSLVINTNGGTITSKQFPAENTYDMLDKLMSGTATAGGKMRSPRANLMSLQKALIKYGYMSESDIDSMADWGSPTHEKTREVLANLMYIGNLTGESWLNVLSGAGLSRKQQTALYSGNGPGGSGSGAEITQFVTKKTDLSNRKDARALLRATMQQALGRNPTKEEIGQFLTALNREERQNPNISTQNIAQSGSTQNTDVVNESGLNRDEYATSYVQNEFAREANAFEGDNYEMMILNAIGGLS